MNSVNEDGPRRGAGPRHRRREHEDQARPRGISFRLSEEEFAEVKEAASQAGLAKGAYAAEATLAAARGLAAGAGTRLQEAALAELKHSAKLFSKVGTLFNQAVAKLHATGQPPGELAPCAETLMRWGERLNQAAEEVLRALRRPQAQPDASTA